MAGFNMKNVDSWDFNVWECKEADLASLALKMFQPFFSIVSENSLGDFLREVQNNYSHRPYHNFRHVLDVTQFIHKLDREGILAKKLSIEERFILHVAGLCHDIGHPGKNNDYQKELHTEIYTEFGSESTLERYHLFLTLNILEKHNLLENDLDFAEEMLSRLILATDMTHHDFILKEIKKGKHDAVDVAVLVIKCADLGQLIRPKPVSDIWVKALYNELEMQREEEASHGILDHLSKKEFLEKQTAYQPVFIQKFALPLFQELAAALPELSSLVERVKKHLETCQS
jgi:hypothetical protein